MSPSSSSRLALREPSLGRHVVDKEAPHARRDQIAAGIVEGLAAVSNWHLTPAQPDPRGSADCPLAHHTFTSPKRAKQSNAAGPFPISGLGTVDVKDPWMSWVLYWV